MSQEFKYIVRIADKDLPGDQNLPYALAKIKGIGINTAMAICRYLGLSPYTKLGTLSAEQIKKIDELVRDLTKINPPRWFVNRPRDPFTGEDKHLVGSDLIIAVKGDIEFLKKIKCWRGIRHALGLKVRGQCTRTTGRTGITVGVKRRKK